MNIIKNIMKFLQGTVGWQGSEFETSLNFVPEGNLADIKEVFKTYEHQTDFLFWQNHKDCK